MARYKNFFVLTLCVLLVVLPIVACAEIDQVITFMGIPWEESGYPYLTVVRQEMGYKDSLPNIEKDFDSIGAVCPFDPRTLQESVEWDCGFLIDLTGAMYNEKYEVAGYPTLRVAGYSVYDVADGIVNTNPISSHPILMRYELDYERIVDANEAYADLQKKLSVLYGECDNEYTEKLGDRGERHRSIWLGKDSYVMLELRFDENDEVLWLRIIYGIDDPYTLIEYVRNPELTVTPIEPDIVPDPNNISGL